MTVASWSMPRRASTGAAARRVYDSGLPISGLIGFAMVQPELGGLPNVEVNSERRKG
jgi:hypothetical protein